MLLCHAKSRWLLDPRCMQCLSATSRVAQPSTSRLAQPSTCRVAQPSTCCVAQPSTPNCNARPPNSIYQWRQLPRPAGRRSGTAQLKTRAARQHSGTQVVQHSSSQRTGACRCVCVPGEARDAGLSKCEHGMPFGSMNSCSSQECSQPAGMPA